MKSEKLFRAVKKQIDSYDAYGLLEMGAPKDEFDIESRMITNRLQKGMMTYSIARVIADVMCEMFTPDFEAQEFVSQAKAIKAILEKIHPQKTDKKYYSVEFSERGYTYTYDYDGSDIDIGDKVVVPVGKNNIEKIGLVVEYDYLLLDELTFPLNAIKKIIKKFNSG